MNNLALQTVADTPAPTDEQIETRSTQHLLDYWRSLCGTRAFPSMAYFNIETVPSVVQHSFLLDLSASQDNPVFRFAGGSLIEACGTNLADQSMSALSSIAMLNGVRDNYRLVVAEARPIEFSGDAINAKGEAGKYRGVLLPLSEDGKSVDCVVGTVNFKLTNDEAVVFDARALSDSLMRCRAIADDFKAAESRSHKTLYRALASAYAFYFESQTNPEAYQDLLTGSGLTVQERAPFQPVIKLIFGIDYDKTRVSEYAAALSYAERCGQRAESIGVFIEKHEGGIKGCVAAERSQRRVSKGDTSNRLENAKKVLRKAAAIAEISGESVPEIEEEFVVMIARRSESGSGLEVIQIMDEKPSAMEGIVKRAARQARKDAKSQRA